MAEIFSEELTGKTAMTSGGYPIGTIDDIVFDTESGEMKYLLVKITSAMKPGQRIDEKGRAVVAFNLLKIAGDNVIIS